VQGLSAALAIAGRVLRQRIRDRSAIIFAVLTPLGLAVAFATLIPNDFTAYRTQFVVVDGDQGPLARVLVDEALGSLAAQGIAEISEVATEAEAIQLVKAGQAGAGIIIPPGLSDAVTRGEPTGIRIISGEFVIAVEVARSVVVGFADAVGAAQLMVATVAAAGGPVDPATVARAQDAIHEASPIAIAEARTDSLQAGLATFYGAAMAIMFVFFATQYGALAILADREVGTLNRLLAAPIRPAAIILGSSLAGFVLGLVSMTVLVVATTLLVGASWGPPPLVAALILAAVVAAMGISTLAATLARTVRAASGLNAIIAISLSAIGGVFIPLSQAPEIMSTVAQVTPHAWFLRGIGTLAGSNPSLADLAPSLVVPLGMGLVTGAIGLSRARRSLVA
jgi:ABC-2 type transport system permease protein